MATRSMSFEQQYLPEGDAVRVPATATDRELQVTAGRLWLTGGETGPGDVWLGPGDRHLLRAGQEAVIEGWPSASYQLQTRRAPAPLGGWRRLWTAVFAPARGAATSMPPACGSC